MTTYTLYFAYGSNLDDVQMTDRCPSAIQVATGSLPGYRLAFSGWSYGRNGGVANVRRSKKSQKVRGMIWEISERDLHALDGFEGYPTQYDRKLMTITDRHGRRQRCWVYYMKGRRPDARPSMEYYSLIAAAYTDFGFALRRLTAAMLRAPVRTPAQAQIAPLRALPKLSANSDAEADQAWVEWLATAKG